MVFLQPQSQVARVPVVALFANWFEVDLVELCLDCHLLVAGGAGEVVHAPRLVQGREHVSLDDVVANMAEVSEQLVVVCLAISQSFPLVVAISQERLLAFGADEVFHAPMLAQGGHNSALDRSPARTANRNAHTVMAS